MTQASNEEMHGSHGPTNWRGGLWRIVPYVFAVTTGIQVLRYLFFQPYIIGLDARLYAAAARTWLAGGNPWGESLLGVYFAAPPPTLLAFVPFSGLSPEAVSVVWVGGSFLLAAAALRSLKMPMWWLAFWPIVDGALIGNPDVAVLALLVLARGRLSPIAVFFKLYALGPIVGERRYRELAIAAGLLAVTALILPWSSWLSQLPTITAHLKAASPTTSVYGNPFAMLIAVVALLAIGLKRAGWLAVPALWPYTQAHYLAISVPALSPVLAIAWSFPHPAIVVGGLVIEALTRVGRLDVVLERLPTRARARLRPDRPDPLAEVHPT